MSDTPRTDSNHKYYFSSINGLRDPSGDYVPIDFARQLERELNEAKVRLETRRQICKDNDEYEIKLSQQLDQWRKCAEELAGWVAECAKDYNDPHFTDRRQTGPCLLKALAHFNELKGQP